MDCGVKIGKSVLSFNVGSCEFEICGGWWKERKNKSRRRQTHQSELLERGLGESSVPGSGMWLEPQLCRKQRSNRTPPFPGLIILYGHVQRQRSLSACAAALSPVTVYLWPGYPVILDQDLSSLGMSNGPLGRRDELILCLFCGCSQFN